MRRADSSNSMASPKPDSPKPDSPKPPKPKSKKGGGDDDTATERVNVVVRIRPPVRHDEKFGEGSEALQHDADKNMLYLLQKEDSTKSKNASAPKQFVFDKVLWKDSVQEDAWHAAGTRVVTGSMEGYTGCVMCYGQTGGGKTYTSRTTRRGTRGSWCARST